MARRRRPPGPRRNITSLKEIMAFWLDRGVAGFRIDMAFSLVKGNGKNGGAVASTALWRGIRDWLDATYPDAVIVPEGKEPRTGAPLAFHADFFLVIHEEHASLFDNHFAGTLPFHASREPYFDAAGAGSARTFLDSWNVAKTGGPRATDHPVHRRPRLQPTVLWAADRRAARAGPHVPAHLGVVPCVYYGDEIGMRYLPGTPDVEGAICNPSYNRAGCRTPMQWDDTPNAGFSTADQSRLYLPIDPDPARPPSQRRSMTRTRPSTSSDDSSPCARRHPRSGRARAPRCCTTDTPSPTSATRPTSWWSTHATRPPPSTGPPDRHHVPARRRCRAITEGTVHADGFGYGVFALSGR